MITNLSETARSSPIPRRRPETLTSRALDREGFLRRLDWVMVGAVAVLCVMGCALVWAATRAPNAWAGLGAKPIGPARSR